MATPTTKIRIWNTISRTFLLRWIMHSVHTARYHIYIIINIIVIFFLHSQLVNEAFGSLLQQNATIFQHHPPYLSLDYVSMPFLCNRFWQFWLFEQCLIHGRPPEEKKHKPLSPLLTFPFHIFLLAQHVHLYLFQLVLSLWKTNKPKQP